MEELRNILTSDRFGRVRLAQSMSASLLEAGTLTLSEAHARGTLDVRVDFKSDRRALTLRLENAEDVKQFANTFVLNHRRATTGHPESSQLTVNAPAWLLPSAPVSDIAGIEALICGYRVACDHLDQAPLQE
eukprot:367053_1